MLAWSLAKFEGGRSVRSVRVLGGGPPQPQGMLGKDGVWRGHYWVEANVGSNVVLTLDITADQFGYPPVLVLDAHAAGAIYRPGDQAQVDDAVGALVEEFNLPPVEHFR